MTQSTEQSIEERRVKFIDNLLAEASSSGGRLDFSAIAKYGKSIGLLSTEEVRRLQGGAKFPVWALDLLKSHQFTAIATGYKTIPLRKFDEQAAPNIIAVKVKFVRVSAANFARTAFCDGGLIPEMTNPNYAWLIPFIKEAETKQKLGGFTFDGIVEGSALYSHWLFDTLPKLIFAAEHFPLDQFDQFLFASIHQPFHKEALDALDIPVERCISRQALGSIFDIDHVLWVSEVRNGFVMSKDSCDCVRRLFQVEKSRRPTRRFYISRAKASKRRVVNEEELRPILESRGYETVFLEDFGIRGAASLFADAEHIVGPHGAGFSNILFAPPGCRVTEFYSDHLTPEFQIIAGIIGQEHSSVKCRSLIDSDDADFFTINSADMIVDADLMRSHLK